MADELLTGKQEAFCNEYLVDLNGTKAAIRAGYAVDSAAEMASENLRKPHIQARITELRQSVGKAFNITRERIAQELAKIAFSNVAEAFEEDGSLKSPENWPDGLAGVIAGVESDELFEGAGKDRERVGFTKKIKLWDKTKAIEILNRMMGFNEPDKKEVAGKSGGPIETELRIKIIRDKGNVTSPSNTSSQPADSSGQ